MKWNGMEPRIKSGIGILIGTYMDCNEICYIWKYKICCSGIETGIESDM